MSDDLRGFLRSLGVVYETLRASGPFLSDAARGKLDRSRADQRIDQWSRRMLERVGATITVSGRENAEGLTPCVVMSNHQSHFDIPVLYQSLPGSMRMVAKKELFNIPVFSQAMTAAGIISVDRSDRAKAIESLREAQKRLAEGINVWIAPEGTRSVDGNLGVFKKGGFALAIDAALPILPVAIEGTRRILSADSVSTQSNARVHVCVLPPIPAYHGPNTSEARDQLMEQTRAAIEKGLQIARERLAAEAR